MKIIVLRNKIRKKKFLSVETAFKRFYFVSLNFPVFFSLFFIFLASSAFFPVTASSMLYLATCLSSPLSYLESYIAT